MNLDRNKQVYSMDCSQMSPFSKAQIIQPSLPTVLQSVLWANSWPLPRWFMKTGQCHRQHVEPCHAWRCIVECESLLQKWNQNVSTNSRAQTYTHIYTYTQTKYMASNVESRQLNKWHFLLCFFFSWYRHDQTWCSSSTLVWVDTMNIISFHPFFSSTIYTSM